jgi:hypothetical protein
VLAIGKTVVSVVNDNDREEPKYLEKNLSLCTVPTTNPTWTGLGLNPHLPSERPDEIEARTSVPFLIHV